MGENAADIALFDVSNLSARDVETLGPSALGYAVRRAITPENGAPDRRDEEPIAAHESHV